MVIVLNFIYSILYMPINCNIFNNIKDKLDIDNLKLLLSE